MRLAVVALLSVSLLAALFLTWNAKRTPALVGSVQLVEASQSLAASPLPEIPTEAIDRSEVPGPAKEQADPEITARSYLREYWGERWPEIERAMLAAGLNLDRPFVPVPWETAAEAIEPKLPRNAAERAGATVGLFQWPTDLDATAMVSWLRREFRVPSTVGLDEADLLVINDIVREQNDEIAVLATEWLQKIDSYTLERWRTGDFVKAPFGTIGVSTELGFTSKSIGAEGWSIVITLDRERYPDMEQIENRASALREARDRAVTLYLRRLSGR